MLVIGGFSSASRSVEFWSPANPDEGSCELSHFPREINFGPTANLVSSGHLLVCYEDSCEIYNNEGQWNHSTETRSSRRSHSTAVKEDRILLIGGYDDSRSTEWISADGSPSQAEAFYISISHFLKILISI